MQEEFIRERRYLKNVSPATITWYEQSFRAFAGALESKATVLDRIEKLTKAGKKAISINTYLRCVNAYFRWLATEHGKPQPRIPTLKEDEAIIAPFSPGDVQRILTFKPRTFAESRFHALLSTLLDTGLRISEALSLKRDAVDFDNLLLTVWGKGRKQRKVPMSLELRKVLYRFLQKHKFDFVFATRNGTATSARNAIRSCKALQKRLRITGVRFSPHTCRHTFAVNYLRAGGNLYYLSRILGHTSVTTTERYLQAVGVQDLRVVHDRLSVLGNGGR